MKALPAMSLSDRIAAVLNDDARAADAVRALLAEVQPEIARLKRRAATVLEDALNPRRTAAQVAELRAAADEAEFEVARIERAAAVLEEEAAALSDVEAEDARAKRYDRVKAQAAATAARIVAEYPWLADKLLALVGEVVAVTREVVAVNVDLPAGRDLIRGPEDIARGFNLTAGTSPDRAPWLLAELVLPPFAPSDIALWPRSETGGGLWRRSKDQPKFNPWTEWPKESQVEAARAELAAQVEPDPVAVPA